MNAKRDEGSGKRDVEPRETLPASRFPIERRATCLRCGFSVPPKPWGCKNPCPNCGFVYPLGDCSD